MTSPKAKRALRSRRSNCFGERETETMTSVLWPVIASLQPVASIFVMVSDENHEFSSTLLHARKSRANSEISELLTARRMDITVWMSSSNDVVPAVAEAGSDTGGSRRTASPDGSGAALGGSVGFGFYPRVDGARGRGLVCFPQDRGSYLDPEVGATGSLSLGLLGLGLL
ncbi:hypothetical protein EVAR_61888_1 [Eumeta japonica]|uniref:Uncharacterized protein n=1 Tax=Eumeta variegata TaxID=151549 RepID=A0A4C1Z150_EUMVA|nr:hypothetical protein EVAR_61888_1 [Eumeta japonica]